MKTIIQIDDPTTGERVFDRAFERGDFTADAAQAQPRAENVSNIRADLLRQRIGDGFVVTVVPAPAAAGPA